MKTLFSAVSVRARICILAVTVTTASLYGAAQLPGHGAVNGATLPAETPSVDEDVLVSDDFCKQAWVDYYLCLSGGGGASCVEPDCNNWKPEEHLGELLEALTEAS